jgi:hypothetical protein
MAEHRGTTALETRFAPSSGQPDASAHADPGVAGNARLTGMNAVVLLVLLAIEGLTILAIRRVLPQHLFFGFILIPPVLLKMGSTGYRFLRYYAGDRRYRAAGPPQILLRLLAPLVVITTVVLFATGVELWLFGRQYGSVWLSAHQLSFVLWFGAMTVHVLGYVFRAPNLALADYRSGSAVSGSGVRMYLVGATLLLGVVLAVASTHYATPFVIFPEH